MILRLSLRGINALIEAVRRILLKWSYNRCCKLIAKDQQPSEKLVKKASMYCVLYGEPANADDPDCPTA